MSTYPSGTPSAAPSTYTTAYASAAPSGYPQTLSVPSNPNSDTDGPAAKKHGDYFYDVGDYQSAIGYYKEAANKGDLQGDPLSIVYFNLAQCYHHLNDPQSAYPWAHQAIKTGTVNANDINAYKIFFWAATNGETPGQS